MAKSPLKPTMMKSAPAKPFPAAPKKAASKAAAKPFPMAKKPMAAPLPDPAAIDGGMPMGGGMPPMMKGKGKK